MKDIIKLYKEYGLQVGLIGTVYFLIFPMNLMLRFVFFEVKYDIFGLISDMIYVLIALGFAKNLKNKNIEVINQSKIFHTIMISSELLIFILSVILIILLMVKNSLIG